MALRGGPGLAVGQVAAQHMVSGRVAVLCCDVAVALGRGFACSAGRLPLRSEERDQVHEFRFREPLLQLFRHCARDGRLLRVNVFLREYVLLALVVRQR